MINNFIPKLLLLTLCIYSLNRAKENLIQRYEKKDDLYANIGSELATTRHYLDSLGVPEKAKIIILADQTPNSGLYFINRPGWNIRDTTENSLNDLNNSIKKGADYIIFTDKKYIYKGFRGQKIGEEKGILIYQLKKR